MKEGKLVASEVGNLSPGLAMNMGRLIEYILIGGLTVVVSQVSTAQRS